MSGQDKEQPPIDLDALLPELGTFGRYQIFVFFYLGLAVFATSIHTCQFVFNAGQVKYRCKVPECESTPENYTTSGWNKFALPPLTGYDCYRKVPIGKSCEQASFSNELKRCDSWVYENQLTIVPEYNLACQEWKRTMVGTVHNIGVLVAIPVTATCSDMLGRRFALIATSVLPAIFGAWRAYCYNYLFYLVLEFIEAVVGNCTYSTAFIMGLEIVGNKKRVLGGNILHCTYAVAQMAAAALAWAMPYWRTYTLFIFAPAILFFVYCFFVEESVRWLIVHGKRDEAVRVILKMAKWNRVTLLPETMKMLTSGPPVKPITVVKHQVQTPIVEPVTKERSIMSQVLHSKTMMFRILVVSFWWIATTLNYYGLSINSVSLKGNMYINYMLTALVEIPGAFLCLFLLDRFGRKPSIMISFWICGLSLLILPVVNNAKMTLILTLVGKMMVSLIYCGIYIYTIELFPTKARHVMLGMCSMTGRIGSISAPQTPLLMLVWEYLPFVLFGTMAGLAGTLLLLTPETLHMKLPDTIEQAEQMSRHTNKTPDLLKNKKTLGETR